MEDLSNLSAQILMDFPESKIFTFAGQLGAGKTTLIKALSFCLGYRGEVTSPTFSLINEYPIEGKMVYHMDLYRLKDVNEALDIGIEEYLYSGHYCFIEWPQIVKSLMDAPHNAIKISADVFGFRKIEVTFVSQI